MQAGTAVVITKTFPPKKNVRKMPFLLKILQVYATKCITTLVSNKTSIFSTKISENHLK
jgi:hypothetical protein